MHVSSLDIYTNFQFHHNIKCPFFHYFAQTLTTLNLAWNGIGDQGAQYLANALQKNQVTFSISHSIMHSLFQTDTHHTEPHLKLYRCSRSTTSCKCSTRKSSNVLNLSFYYSLTLSNRHSPHWTSVGMRSVRKEHNTLPLLYKKIK